MPANRNPQRLTNTPRGDQNRPLVFDEKPFDKDRRALLATKLESSLNV